MSNGVFVSGMFTKDDPVTWEIRVPSARESGDRRQGKTVARGYEDVEVGGPRTSGDVGEGRQPTRPNKGGPCQ